MMQAASLPIQRPKDARLLVIDRCGRIHHRLRSAIVDLVHAGDCVIANDAATLPASLHGIHEPTGVSIEVRLASRASLDAHDVRRFSCIVFGAGDFRTATEAREAPPRLAPGDRLRLGPLQATIVRTLDHPRFVELDFHGSTTSIWQGLAAHGRPVQYAHVPQSLGLWDVWTPIAAQPVAFEPPSAGFVLDWHTVKMLRDKGASFATLTHAAGLSSTGDASLDERLPLDEPYRIPPETTRLIAETGMRGGRVIAIGTTVVRALEHAAMRDGSVRVGNGVASGRIGRHTRLRIVDVIVSGTHEPDSSHYALLSAFVAPQTLAHATSALEIERYRTHEFGDSMWVERDARKDERRCECEWAAASA
jgi:S-adenosylmethionine:tRNA ribosyltransferase-isomerase